MLNSLAIPQPKGIIPDQDTAQVIADWHQALDQLVKSGDLAETTARTYKKGLDKFLTWCEAAGIFEADFETIQAWKAALLDQHTAAGAINTWLSGVKSFYRWAFTNRRIAFNPAAGIRSAKRKGTSVKHKRESLTDLEVIRLLKQPDTTTAEGLRDKAMLALYVYTGVRTVEIHRAEVKDLRTIGNKMVLDVTGKGHDEADELVVIVNPAAQNALYDWLTARGTASGAIFSSLSDRSRGQALSLSAIRTIVKKHMKAAGIQNERKTTHSLRHTAITSAIRHGATPMQARAMARHKSLDTTMIYYHELDRLENPAENFIDYGEKPQDGPAV